MLKASDANGLSLEHGPELAAEPGLSTRSVAGYDAGLSMLRADNLDAIMGVLRQRGIRFLEEMGMLLVKQDSAQGR
jgi:hypothetical protein